MKLQGNVKVEAVVAPDGSAKTVAIRGGHPLLAQAAHDAVQKWKWVPAPKETRELIEVKFNLGSRKQKRQNVRLWMVRPFSVRHNA
jgi:TonB family protein